jgi:UDP-N-acetylmuramoyl-tripeptide--D-alanyl-D-alanine ligase
MEPLAFCTRLIIRKKKVKVIGVTGSLGKTTTTNFIYKVLKEKYPQAFLNNDLTTGVPTLLSIFGCKTTLKLWEQIVEMFLVFGKTIILLLNKKKEFPSHLILELRCHYHGKNLRLLTKKLKPDIRIITAIEIVHAQSLGNLSQIASHKKALVKYACLHKHFAVLNYDDPYVREMSKCTIAKIIYYGLDDKADVKATNIKINENGLTFNLKEKSGANIVFNVPNILDKAHVYAILVSIIVGRIYQMSWSELKKAVSLIKPVKGRGNLTSGIKNSIVINNTYNANIRSMKSAINSLASFSSNKRKVAILGDILELHKFSDRCHKEVGKTINNQTVNFLVTIGENAQKIREGAIENGFEKKNMRHYKNVEQALMEIDGLIKKNDVILIKASHGMKLDKIVDFLTIHKK